MDNSKIFKPSEIMLHQSVNSFLGNWFAIVSQKKRENIDYDIFLDEKFIFKNFNAESDSEIAIIRMATSSFVTGVNDTFGENYIKCNLPKKEMERARKFADELLNDSSSKDQASRNDK